MVRYGLERRRKFLVIECIAAKILAVFFAARSLYHGVIGYLYVPVLHGNDFRREFAPQGEAIFWEFVRVGLFLLCVFVVANWILLRVEREESRIRGVSSAGEDPLTSS